MLSQKLRECGVVGAGGAGFPTGVKADSRVELMIANGAECEPLIHKDAELMQHFPKPILAGMLSMMDSIGAARGKFGIKGKHADADAKTAAVELIEIRLAMALGGEAFVTLTGDVAAEQSAVEAGAQMVARKGLLVNKVVIPRPQPELLSEMI